MWNIHEKEKKKNLLSNKKEQSPVHALTRMNVSNYDEWSKPDTEMYILHNILENAR